MTIGVGKHSDPPQRKTTNGADIVLITTQKELRKATIQARTWPVISLDLETAHDAPVEYDQNGKVKKSRLDYNLLSLRSIQFGNEKVVYVVDCALLKDWKIPEFIDLMQNKQYRKIAHNSSFEYRVLALHDVVCDNLACTMQAERVLFMGLLMKRPSLAELVQKYCGREMEKDVRDTFIEERYVQPLREEQILYAADDVDVLIPIFNNQMKQLQEANLVRVAEFEWAVQRAFGNIMNRGIYLDTKMWRDILVETTLERDKIHQQLFESFKPAAVRRWQVILEERERKIEKLQDQIDAADEHDPNVAKWRAELAKLPSWLKKKPNKEGIREPKKTAMWPFDKVLTSPSQLRHAFYQFGIDLPDTNERTLLRIRREYTDLQVETMKSGKKLPDNFPLQGLQAIQMIMDFRTLDKRVTGYGENWINSISCITGLIHADYDTLKDTARTGCSEPNIQNIPKRGDGKKYRRCFPTRKGMKYVIGDYSQIELRVAAELSGDKNMIKAFNSGLDIHIATAALMFKVDPSTIDKKDPRRTAAKAVNFGILFGIGAQKLSEQITNEPGAPPCSLEQAKTFLRLYSQAYPQLLKWLADMGQSAKDELEVFTVLGHRRRFNRPIQPSRHDYSDPREFKEAQDKYRAQLGSIEREGKNTPVQGSAAVIAKWAILDLERKLPKGAGINLFVHDEIGIQCLPEQVEEVKVIMKDCMEKAGARFMKKVPCLVEIEEYGDNWLGEQIEA